MCCQKEGKGGPGIGQVRLEWNPENLYRHSNQTDGRDVLRSKERPRWAEQSKLTKCSSDLPLFQLTLGLPGHYHFAKDSTPALFGSAFPVFVITFWLLTKHWYCSGQLESSWHSFVFIDSELPLEDTILKAWYPGKIKARKTKHWYHGSPGPRAR